MISRLLPEPYRERYVKRRRRKSSVYTTPPDGEASPTTIERWERDPTDLAFSIMYCAECYKGQYCEFHRDAKTRLNEYRVEGDDD